MKRTIKSFLASAGLAFIGLGSLLSASPAFAINPIQSVTQGGITCSQYPTNYGAWPNTIWDCVNPPGGVTALEQGIGSAARNLPANVKNTLNAVELYVFNNKADFTAFTGTAVPAGPAYFGWKAPSKAAAFKNVTINGAPTVVSNYYATSILQQLGRHYDSLTGFPSQDTTATALFNTARLYDVDVMNAQTTNTTWGAAIAAQYPAQNSYQILGTLFGNTNSDLYAFQFQSATGQAGYPTLQNFLTSWVKNTRGYAKNYALGPVVNQAVANNGILCVEYATNYGTYPTKIWNCAHAWGNTGAENSFASNVRNLPLAFRNLLTANGVKLYVADTIFDYQQFTGLVPPSLVNIYGATDRPGKRVFVFNYIVAANGVTQTGVSGFWAGTVVHEIGHQLDYIWNNPSITNQAWLNAILADKAAFITGTCAAKVDADRITAGLSPICTLPANAGKDNWQVLSTVIDMGNDELWGRAFAKAQPQSVLPQYANLIQARFPNMNAYMTTLYTNGAP